MLEPTNSTDYNYRSTPTPAEGATGLLSANSVDRGTRGPLILHMGDLIIVSGPPGAGKSAVGSVLVDMFDPGALVEGDSFFGFVRRGFIEPWLAASKRQNEVLVGAAASAAGRLAVGGYTVVYDGVIGPWFLATFASSSGALRLHYVLLLPPEPICVERVVTRVGHGFSDVDATRHMYKEFAAAPIDRRHVIEMLGDPTEVAALVHDHLGSGRFLVEGA